MITDHSDKRGIVLVALADESVKSFLTQMKEHGFADGKRIVAIGTPSRAEVRPIHDPGEEIRRKDAANVLWEGQSQVGV